jgi:hypothetical protein
METLAAVVAHKLVALQEVQTPSLEIPVALAIRTILVVLVTVPRDQTQEARIQEILVAREAHLPMTTSTLEAQAQVTTMAPELRREGPPTMVRRMGTLAEAQEAVALLAMAALDQMVDQVAMSSFLCLLSLPLVLPRRLWIPVLLLLLEHKH